MLNPRETSFTQLATGKNDFLVQPLVISPQHNQSTMRDLRWAPSCLVGNDTRSNAVQVPLTAKCPYLAAQMLEAALNETMVEVYKHHIIAPVGKRVVKDNRPNLVRVRVLQPLGREAPGAG